MPSELPCCHLIGDLKPHPLQLCLTAMDENTHVFIFWDNSTVRYLHFTKSVSHYLAQCSPFGEQNNFNLVYLEQHAFRNVPCWSTRRSFLRLLTVNLKFKMIKTDRFYFFPTFEQQLKIQIKSDRPTVLWFRCWVIQSPLDFKETSSFSLGRLCLCLRCWFVCDWWLTGGAENRVLLYAKTLTLCTSPTASFDPSEIILAMKQSQNTVLSVLHLEKVDLLQTWE